MGYTGLQVLEKTKIVMGKDEFFKMESGIYPIFFIQANPNEATLGFAREYLDF